MLLQTTQLIYTLELATTYSGQLNPNTFLLSLNQEKESEMRY